jgi:hypothetical protein
MSYTLNSVNLSTYGIVASQAPQSNIALQEWCNMPERIGETYYSWGDEDSVEPYVDADDIFFAGRDLVFYGNIFGENDTINAYLKSFYAAINAFSDLVTFSTPYGDFDVQVKDIDVQRIVGACSIVITLREPVVDLSGELPAEDVSDEYTFDRIPFSSFGLYLSSKKIYDLPELKEQFFTQYGSEGYQIVKRENNTLEINACIVESSLSNFKTKVSALYKLFSSASTRLCKLNDEVYIDCFAIDGFSIENIYLLDNTMVGNFNCSLVVVSTDYLSELLDKNGINILTESGEKIFVKI